MTQQLVQKGALVEWFSAAYVAIDARDATHAQDVEAFLQEQQLLGNLEYETGD